MIKYFLLKNALLITTKKNFAPAAGLTGKALTGIALVCLNDLSLG